MLEREKLSVHCAPKYCGTAGSLNSCFISNLGSILNYLVFKYLGVNMAIC